jgi:hypothetical protein
MAKKIPFEPPMKSQTPRPKPIPSLALSILCAAAFALLVPSAPAQTKILFVGNSFTHGNNEPAYSFNRTAIRDANGTGQGGVAGIFKKLTDDAGLSYSVTIETVGGKTLAFHAKERSAVLGAQRCDVAVLQELSTGPLPLEHGGQPEKFRAGARDLQVLLKAKNPDVKIILYETWASPASVKNQHYSDLRAMQDDLKKGYGKPAEDLRCSLAPVGEAFAHAVEVGLTDPENRPTTGKIPLWAADNRHASKYGSYLSACVIFELISGVDPENLKAGVASAADGLGINANDAKNLQRIAHEAVRGNL